VIFMPRDSVNVPADADLGARIKAARTRRGMSRAAVAGLCGKTEDWLKKLEGGLRGTSLKMVVRLAEVLKVSSLTDLLGAHAPTGLYARPEHTALDAVRRALTTYGPTDASSPDLATLQQRIRRAWRLRSVSSQDRSDLAAVLPRLIVDAQAAVRAAGSSARNRHAYRLQAEVGHLGQLYLCYQDAPELLWVVADRALNAAYESQDATSVARAAWFCAYLYRDFGLVSNAHQVVDDALRLVEPQTSPVALRQRSVLHLASACNHAREGRPAQAWRAWDAAVATDQAGASAPSPYALFGATIPDVALTLDVELGKTASALRRAQATDTEAIVSVPRRTRLTIEAARAYMLKREHASAVHMLQRAQRTSPEATLYSMHARSIVVELLAHAGPILRPEVTNLAEHLDVAE
jgi:transcriptional regulator with XRE-family HTH domain